MRVSRTLIPTLKETPQEAEVPSHRLMMRAGLIRKVAAGVYEWLPMGRRVLLKVERIIREEMERAGAQEVLLPVLTPAELWQETGRWARYGRELMRLKDRHERDYALGPTHEEVITDLVRRELQSYKQLPLNLYQIAVKFRDEVRPRFGVMRSREFLMKDGYSFDADEKAAAATYQSMVEAYTRIFRRCGLCFTPVEADSGLMGGSLSHEFMALAETGEAVIAFCQACRYAANLEKAEGKPSPNPAPAPKGPRETRETPGKHTVEEVAAFLGVPPAQLVKTLVLEADGKPVAVLIRGDHELNLVKVQRRLEALELALASPEVVERATGAPLGFAGPVSLTGMRVLADEALRGAHALVTGGMAKDRHDVNVEIGRDFPEPEWGDFRNVAEGDGCPRCGKPLSRRRGIEVGQIFQLGLKYSKAMKCVFLDESGVEREAVMGCYGIGVTRTPAAVLEQSHDAGGIIWPISIAPYEVHLLLLNADAPDTAAAADALYDELQAAGFEVLYDDRKGVSAGFKFKDADLLGLPLQVRVGSRGLKEGTVELKRRREKGVVKVPRGEALARLKELAEEEWKLCAPA